MRRTSCVYVIALGEINESPKCSDNGNQCMAYNRLTKDSTAKERKKRKNESKRKKERKDELKKQEKHE
jgi:hypothetical protein